MKRIICIAALAALISPLSAFAQKTAEEKAARKEAVKEHLENHFKFYGFIRNYFAFDSRESTAGTGDLYYYMPKDNSWNFATAEEAAAAGEERQDLNAIPSFRYLSLTSRAGVDVSGYELKGFKFGAKLEADFYAGVSGVTGTAQFRLRQAYATVQKDWASMKLGQAWHPMAADLPDIFSLESGVPFGPFSRTPQLTFDFALGKGFSLTASLIWQMQYTSTGPDGASANYIKYSCTPESYLGFNFKNDKVLFRLGAEVLSIKPRNYLTRALTDASGQPILDGDGVQKTAKFKTRDRLTTWNVFFYGQQNAGGLVFKEKVTYANDGSHMNLIGGYGVSGMNEDGSWEYSATRNVSAWATIAYKKNKSWMPSILVGYIKEFGTPKEIVGDFWFKNSANAVNQMYRIQPEIVYTIGKFQFGLEYMMTAVHYGKCNTFKLATDNLHWVYNHRAQAMIKFNF